MLVGLSPSAANAAGPPSILINSSRFLTMLVNCLASAASVALLVLVSISTGNLPSACSSALRGIA